jgi:hypothetical protein
MTSDRLQNWLYEVTSRTEVWDRVTRKLFPEYEGGIIVSDAELDLVRERHMTSDGIKYLGHIVPNIGSANRSLNAKLYKDLEDNSSFTIRPYVMYMLDNGFITVEVNFEYPPSVPL